MATRFEWFNSFSENYSRPILENKKLTLLLWALFLPMAGTQIYSFAKGFFPEEPEAVVPVAAPASAQPDYALKGHGHPTKDYKDLEERIRKNTNSIKKLKILHNIK